MKRILITFLTILSVASMAIARQPHQGYRGFIDWSNNYRTEPSFFDMPRTSIFYSGLSTTHGYQIDSNFFAGAGLDIEYCSYRSTTSLAIFAEGRYDVQFEKFTPFGDIRLGYNAGDGGGVYFSPSVGYRFNWGRKVGINLALGLSLYGYTRDVFELQFYDTPDNGGIYYDLNYIGRKHGVDPYFSFRVGFDF